MRLLNVPPFKVGDRVCLVLGSRDYTVKEVRHYNGKWDVKLDIGGWWYNASMFKRVNENTTEESPSGATVEVNWNADPQSLSRVQSSNAHSENWNIQYTMSMDMMRQIQEAYIGMWER